MKQLSQLIAEENTAGDIKKESKELVERVIYRAQDIRNHNDIPYMCYGAMRIQKIFAYLKTKTEDDARRLCPRYSKALVDFLDKYGLAEFRKLAGKISNAQKKQNEEVGWKYLFIGRYLSKVWGGTDRTVIAENDAITRVLEQMFTHADFEDWAKRAKYDGARDKVVSIDKYDLHDVYAEKGETESDEYVSVSNRASVFSTKTGYTVYVNGEEYTTSLYKSEANRI